MEIQWNSARWNNMVTGNKIGFASSSFYSLNQPGGWGTLRISGGDALLGPWNHTSSRSHDNLQLNCFLFYTGVTVGGFQIYSLFLIRMLRSIPLKCQPQSQWNLWFSSKQGQELHVVVFLISHPWNFDLLHHLAVQLHLWIGLALKKNKATLLT